MFIIVQWSCYQDVSIIRNEDGLPVLFIFRREAKHFAKEHLVHHTCIRSSFSSSKTKFIQGGKS